MPCEPKYRHGCATHDLSLFEPRHRRPSILGIDLGPRPHFPIPIPFDQPTECHNRERRFGAEGSNRGVVDQRFDKGNRLLVLSGWEEQHYHQWGQHYRLVAHHARACRICRAEPQFAFRCLQTRLLMSRLVYVQSRIFEVVVVVVECQPCYKL